MAAFLDEAGIDTLVCTATEYGGSLVPQTKNIRVSTERLDEDDMMALLAGEMPQLVIDATHPYATEVTANIREACAQFKTEYMRVLRQTDAGDPQEGAVYVSDADEAASYLRRNQGNVLLTTGSNDIGIFCSYTGLRSRLVARVLPSEESLKACTEAGIRPEHLVMMQGPFTKEVNEALLRQYDCRFLVTKMSGPAGGFDEKIEACQAAGVTPVIIGAPEQEEGVGYYDALQDLCEKFDIHMQQYVALVGAGMGNGGDLTAEGTQAIEEGELIIGAGRLLDMVNPAGKTLLDEYDADRICAYIKDHPQYRKIVVLLSGDSGFYSGARKLTGKLIEMGCGVFRIPGVSSLSYFMSRLHMAWDDVVIVSNHGRKQNLIPLIRDHEKVFSILGKDSDINQIAESLLAYGMGDVKMYVGEDLSYEDEKILSGTPEEFAYYEGGSLAVVLVVNRNYRETALSPASLREDDMFVRADVPMTKRNVRAVSLDLLDVAKDDVCWDIGAGTGSVSVEMSVRAPEGTVYAIEKKVDAVELIKENRRLFMADNIEIIPGDAPAVLQSLPAPDRVFIGGSAGMMEDIVDACMEKNPHARVVINCIAVDSVAKACQCAYKYSDAPEIIQVQVNKAKKAGDATMMMGGNPVHIIAFEGKGEKE